MLDEFKYFINIKEKKEFRKFGLTVGLFLLIVGAILYWFDLNFIIPVLLIGSLLTLLGLILPILLRPIYIIWMSFAVIAGFIMTRLILTLIFYLIFSPVGVLLRILGKDLLEQKIDNSAETYWRSRKIKPFDPRTAENQF